MHRILQLEWEFREVQLFFKYFSFSEHSLFITQLKHRSLNKRKSSFLSCEKLGEMDKTHAWTAVHVRPRKYMVVFRVLLWHSRSVVVMRLIALWSRSAGRFRGAEVCPENEKLSFPGFLKTDGIIKQSTRYSSKQELNPARWISPLIWYLVQFLKCRQSEVKKNIDSFLELRWALTVHAKNRKLRKYQPTMVNFMSSSWEPKCNCLWCQSIRRFSKAGEQLEIDGFPFNLLPRDLELSETEVSSGIAHNTFLIKYTHSNFWCLTVYDKIIAK